MEAWFRAQALRHIVSGVIKPPTVSATPKEGEEDKLEAWQLKADKAAGIMWLMVDNTQRVHFRGIKDDPLKMWGALKEVHMQKRPGTLFNAYDDLFLIRKQSYQNHFCMSERYGMTNFKVSITIYENAIHCKHYQFCQCEPHG